MSRLACALGALAAFAALVALLYAPLVRWPGLIVAYLAAIVAGAALALALAVALLLLRLFRRG